MENLQNCTLARVSFVNRGLYQLMIDDEIKKGRVSQKLRQEILAGEAVRRGMPPDQAYKIHESTAAEHFPTVGDYVTACEAGSDELQITAIEPRRSVFVRSNFSGHAAEYVKNVVGQAVAANFDYVLVLTSLNQDFNLKRVERYLALAWQSGASPIVVLTKSDLADNADEAARMTRDIAIGAPVFCVSVVTGDGMGELAACFKPGETLVFLGSSGVGKSSLINALAGETLMRVSDIRQDDGEGRHTTTHRQLFKLPSGLVVIDTPGMREVGMWNSGEGLTMAFSDVEEYLGRCRFADCAHRSEPGCAIKEALATGALSQERWERYLQLQREARFSSDKGGYMRQKQNFGKSIAMYSRQRKKETKK